MSILDIFTYPFAYRALIVGVLVCLCAGLLGVNLVLKRYSMLGDGLSHVAFGAAALALTVGVTPMKIAVPIVVIAAFFLLRISKGGKIHGDAAIAIVSSTSLAVGIIIATLTTGMNTDINNYMFGSVLAMSKSDVAVSVIVALTVLVMYLLFYNKIYVCTIDEKFARGCGVNVELYSSMLSVLTAVVVVVGMKMIGALLISSIIIFPAISSMRICKSYKATVICSGVLSCVCFVLGLLISFAYDLPAGASVVAANFLTFLLFTLISKMHFRISL